MVSNKPSTISSDARISLHFLPPATTTARSRRDIELSHSSAKSHLAKSFHRQGVFEIRPKAKRANVQPATGRGRFDVDAARYKPRLKTSLICLDSVAQHETAEHGRSLGYRDLSAQCELCGVSRQGAICLCHWAGGNTAALVRTTSQPDDAFLKSLGLRKLEPYSTVYSGLADQHTMMLLHHCRTSFWPGFGHGSATFHVPPFAFSFDALVSKGPAPFHALVWQAAVNMGFQTKRPIKDVGSLHHYQRAIECISKEIQRPIDDVNESTMFAMLSLTVGEQGTDKTTSFSTQMGFHPPMPRLCWIHVFGRQRVVENHVRALYKLVDLKGGIDSLTMGGFPADMNYMDIIRSTQCLCKPYFRVAKIFGNIQTTHTRRSFFDHAADFEEEALSFNGTDEFAPEIDSLVPCGLSEDFRQIMLDLRIWVRVLAKHEAGTLMYVDHSLMAFHRDLIQHRLLSTISQDDDLSADPQSRIEGLDAGPTIGVDSCVQTALLIFSLGVTFPVSYDGPWRILVRRLTSLLKQHFQELLKLEMHSFLVWLSMLGALCAMQIDHEDMKDWYIDVLCSAERAFEKGMLRKKALCTSDDAFSGIEDRSSAARCYQVVKTDCLESFVWCSSACDLAAQIIWEKVQWRLDSKD